MRVLLGAGGVLKNCSRRVRWYSTEKPFLPPNDICERIRRAIEARTRRIAHLTRLRPVDVKEPETPAMEILCRALASSSAKSKGPKAGGSVDKQGKSPTNQPLGNKPPKIPLIPPENIKPEPQIQQDKGNSQKPDIFYCKNCHEDCPGEDLGTSDSQNCKNQEANGSLLKKEPPASYEPSSKQPTKPRAGNSEPQNEPQVNVAKPQHTPSVKGAQEKAKAARSQSEKPPQNLTYAASPFPLRACGDKQPSNEEIAQKCVGRTKNEAKPSKKVLDDPKEQKVKPESSQPEKRTQNLTDAATTPSKSSFPAGKNPCRDGKQGDGENFKDTALKRSSCTRNNVKVEERKKDSSNKGENKASEQNRPRKPPAQKCVSPKIDESKTKSVVKSSEGLVVDPKKQNVKPASSQPEKRTQNLTDAATTPSDSPLPAGRNPCKDGKRRNGEKSKNKAQTRSSRAKDNMKAVERKEDTSYKQEIKENEQKKPPRKPLAKKCVSPKINRSENKSEGKPSQEVLDDPKEQKVKPKSQPKKSTQNLTDAATTPSNSSFSAGRNPCGDGKQGDGEKFKDTALKRSSCTRKNVKVEERTKDSSNKGEIKASEQKPLAQKCVSRKFDESKTKSEVKSSEGRVVDPKDQIVKPSSSQSKKPHHNPTDSSIPSGRNPCRDGKKSDGEKPKDAALKRSSCSKENVNVEEKKKDSSCKQKMNENDQKKPPTQPPVKEIAQKCVSPKSDESRAKPEVKPSQEVVGNPKEQKVEPASTPIKKCTPPNAESSAKANEKNEDSLNKPKTKESEEKCKSSNHLQVNLVIYDCRTDSQEKPKDVVEPKDAVAEPKEQKVEKEDPPKDWKQPPLPTDRFSFPLLSAFPLGRQPCRDGPRNGSEKEVKAERNESVENYELDVEPEEEFKETSPRKDTMSCLDILKAKAKENSDSAKSGMPTKTTKEIKPPRDHPKGSPGLKPSESVPRESVKEAVKGSEKVVSEAQKASPSVAIKEELREAPKKVTTEAQKASESVSSNKELKESVARESVKEAVKGSERVVSEAQKASPSVAIKEELREAPKKVTTEAQKASESVSSNKELKESVQRGSVKEAVKGSERVVSEAQKASPSVAIKEELRKAPEAQKASESVSNNRELQEASKEVQPETQNATQSILKKDNSMHPERKIPPTGAATSKKPEKSLELKKFPAASLKRTITAYLESIEPLLTPEEFDKELELTEEFEKNEGQELQELLESEAEGSNNWLTPRWTRATYLSYQAPLTTFSSPALSFPVQEFIDSTDCLLFTARAIRAIYEFKKLVDEDKIPVSKMGDNVLDNSQFVKIFGTVRKPQRFCDTIEQYSDSDYVVVVFRNNYFKLPILSSSGNLLSATSLLCQLEAIIMNRLEDGEPYGLLTHDNRDNWAEAYGALHCQPGNAYTLEVIERSLFVVCLDKCVHIPKGQEYIVQAHQLLHGGGIKENSANRWMDKTIQLIINPNGLTGFCYEHSIAECQPLAMMMDYVVEKIKIESISDSESKESNNGEISNPACYLKFQPKDECVNMWLHAAMRNITKIADGLRLNVFEYECHGREFIMAQGLNSDSYIQMALQLAYCNMHKCLPAQYESAHLRMFVDGRTETIRSTSNESKAFVLAMISEDASPIDKIRALQKAVDFHEELTKRALNGEGIDRHLFGLQQMAVEYGLPVPQFFRSKGFVRSVTFQLYTSQVATANDSFMAYGPLTCDGYGCCYNPQECKLTFAISAWQSSRTVNPEAYGKAIKKALDTMRRLILKTGGDRVGVNPSCCDPF